MTQKLITVTERPPNAETPLGALTTSVTPVPLFFIRSNFDVPSLDAGTWQLEIGGSVERPVSLALPDLQRLPIQAVAVTLECAGNGRKRMRPVPAGTAWDLGAVSTAVFTGVRLRDVMALAGIAASAVELVFEGADSGVTEGVATRFIRSLPVERALHEDTLLAWEMNGTRLTAEHGYPVRLLVPGYYGVASVKWLTRISAVETPFHGHFQTDRYVYNGHPLYDDGTPVTQMHVRAVIAQPVDGGEYSGGPIRGIAWSGFGAVTDVEVSTDGGATWLAADVGTPASQYAAVQWELPWSPEPGEYTILARARDATGAVQPLEPVWNELGYGNNLVQRVMVRV